MKKTIELVAMAIIAVPRKPLPLTAVRNRVADRLNLARTGNHAFADVLVTVRPESAIQIAMVAALLEGGCDG